MDRTILSKNGYEWLYLEIIKYIRLFIVVYHMCEYKNSQVPAVRNKSTR